MLVAPRPVLLMDRDGVLNQIVVDPEQGTIGSPLHPDQVQVFPWLPQVLLRLHHAGWRLAVVSNQPAAAKGQTTMDNLQRTHARVMEIAQSAGAELRSFVCWHKSEDACRCRKPRTGLLEDALRELGEGVEPGACWMVGDGVTDVQAGVALHLQTAFLGAQKCDACQVFRVRGVYPTQWASNLQEFAATLLKDK